MLTHGSILVSLLGPAGAFEQKGTVSLWKNAFTAPSVGFVKLLRLRRSSGK